MTAFLLLSLLECGYFLLLQPSAFTMVDFHCSFTLLVSSTWHDQDLGLFHNFSFISFLVIYIVVFIISMVIFTCFSLLNQSFKMDCCLTNTDAYVTGGSEDGFIYFWDLVDASVISSFRAHVSVVK